MKSFINRLKEPSTWAGLAVLASIFGAKPEVINAVMGIVGAVTDGTTTGGAAGALQAITGACAAIAVVVPEKKPAVQ